MNSLILAAATRLLTPILVTFSIFILLRGHNEPGGGFIGGLIAVTAFALYAKAHGTATARSALRADPATLGMVGLALAVLAGLWGAVASGDLLSGVWPLLTEAADGSKQGLPVGSILLFDIGVYLTVIGAVVAILFDLEEDVEDSDRTADAGADTPTLNTTQDGSA